MTSSAWPRSDKVRNDNGAVQQISNICVPTAVQTAIPACAVSCVKTFIVDNYPDQRCSLTADLRYLCTTRTRSGLTIGEGGLQCVLTNCTASQTQDLSVYVVCASVSAAISNQATRITVTVMPKLTSTIESSLSGSSTGTASMPSAPMLTSTSMVPLNSQRQSTTSAAPIAFESVVSIAQTSDPPVVPLFTSDPPPASASAPSSESSAVVSIPVTNSDSAPTALIVPTPNISTSSLPSTLFSTRRSSSSLKSSSSLATISTKLSSTRVSSTVFSSSTATTTSAAAAATATEAVTSVPQSGLSSSAIAGIATASLVAGALIIGYLLWWFVLKRNEEKRKLQRLSDFLAPPPPPSRLNADVLQSSGPAAAVGAAAAFRRTSPERSYRPEPPSRFYAGTTDTKYNNPWVNNKVPAMIPSKPRSFDATITPPSQQPTAPVYKAYRPGLTPIRPTFATNLEPRMNSTRSTTPFLVPPPSTTTPADEHRVSTSTTFSFDESPGDESFTVSSSTPNTIPLIASVDSKSSSVKKPSPLRLRKDESTGSVSGPAGLGFYGVAPKTPRYDNGTFDLTGKSTIRQVPDSAEASETSRISTPGTGKSLAGTLALAAVSASNSPNFSRPKYTVKKSSDVERSPILPQFMPDAGEELVLPSAKRDAEMRRISAAAVAAGTATSTGPPIFHNPFNRTIQPSAGAYLSTTGSMPSPRHSHSAVIPIALELARPSMIDSHENSQPVSESDPSIPISTPKPRPQPHNSALRRPAPHPLIPNPADNTSTEAVPSHSETSIDTSTTARSASSSDNYSADSVSISTTDASAASQEGITIPEASNRTRAEAEDTVGSTAHSDLHPNIQKRPEEEEEGNMSTSSTNANTAAAAAAAAPSQSHPDRGKKEEEKEARIETQAQPPLSATAPTLDPVGKNTSNSNKKEDDDKDKADVEVDSKVTYQLRVARAIAAASASASTSHKSPATR